MHHFLPQRLAIVLCLCGTVFSQSGGVWLDVPFVQQEKNGCGAAVIAMVIDYWGNQQRRPQKLPVDVSAVQQSLYSAPAHGIYSSDLQRYFEDHGFRTFAFKGDWALLREHLEKGRPLIVALKPAKGETALHYVVVAGVDWSSGVVMINDPAQRKLLKVERSRFEKEWQAVNRWTLLAIPR